MIKKPAGGRRALTDLAFSNPLAQGEAIQARQWVQFEYSYFLSAAKLLSDFFCK